MALVAHFYLELHQMDVKTAFLNGDLQEEVYMDQLFGFSQEGSEHLVCRLRKSIYGRVFPSVVNGSKVLFLVLYVDDILLASSDLGLLHDTKAFLIRNFEMKDMGEPHMSWALRFTWPLFSSTAAILEYQIESKISLSYVGSPFAGCDYRILYAELAARSNKYHIGSTFLKKGIELCIPPGGTRLMNDPIDGGSDPLSTLIMGRFNLTTSRFFRKTLFILVWMAGRRRSMRVSEEGKALKVELDIAPAIESKATTLQSKLSKLELKAYLFSRDTPLSGLASLTIEVSLFFGRGESGRGLRLNRLVNLIFRLPRVQERHKWGLTISVRDPISVVFNFISFSIGRALGGNWIQDGDISLLKEAFLLFYDKKPALSRNLFHKLQLLERLKLTPISQLPSTSASSYRPTDWSDRYAGSPLPLISQVGNGSGWLATTSRNEEVFHVGFNTKARQQATNNHLSDSPVTAGLRPRTRRKGTP
ncbi:Retrovirus-related Pol polyprotein from transposon TNT 1-94 [Sesamum angolense]|uniref:Retrovirus-related Pol polyprotein from transposon TNT 1-94 n=1 Tax=Sesamum angolense TaxID=2727404 RepID=A0AAE1T9P9_9LAMI|nr:Retrovirus-related Pol polyprotein from transposon TNT 1-94 [Sesamum angolense]